MDTTTRRALSKPETTDPATGYRNAIQANADRLDSAPVDSSGTLASLPAAGVQGRTYRATDQTPNQVFMDTGSEWLKVHPADALSSMSVDVADLATAAANTWLRIDGATGQKTRFFAVQVGWPDGEETVVANVLHGCPSTPVTAVLMPDILQSSAGDHVVTASVLSLSATTVMYRMSTDSIVGLVGGSHTTRLLLFF